MSRIVVKKCSFSGCESSSLEDSSLRFFSFSIPNVGEWVTACGDESLRQLRKNVLLRHRYVCAKHFCKDDYVYSIYPFIKTSRLKPSAVPKISVEG